MRFAVLPLLLLAVAGCSTLPKRLPSLSDERILPREQCYTLYGGLDVFTDGTAPCPDFEKMNKIQRLVAEQQGLNVADFTEWTLTLTAHEIECGGTPCVGCTTPDEKRMVVAAYTMFTGQNVWHELTHAGIEIRGGTTLEHFSLDFFDTKRGDFDDTLHR